MRKVALSFAALFLFLGAPALSATNVEVAEVVPQIAVQATVDAPTSAQLQLTEIQLEQRTIAEDASAAQVAQRGSFWWLVGAIVIGGVILAVLL